MSAELTATTVVPAHSTQGRIAVLEAHLETLLTLVGGFFSKQTVPAGETHPADVITAQLEAFGKHLKTVAANAVSRVENLADHAFHTLLADIEGTTAVATDEVTDEIPHLTPTAVTTAIDTTVDTEVPSTTEAKPADEAPVDLGAGGLNTELHGFDYLKDAVTTAADQVNDAAPTSETTEAPVDEIHDAAPTADLDAHDNADVETESKVDTEASPSETDVNDNPHQITKGPVQLDNVQNNGDAAPQVGDLEKNETAGLSVPPPPSA